MDEGSERPLSLPTPGKPIHHFLRECASAARAAFLVVAILLFAPMLSADEWTDAGFTALHRVVWLDAGFTLREAKRWKSRCNISDPKQVAEWRQIGLHTPTAVSLWIKKGFPTPDAVVRFRNGDSSGQQKQAVEKSSPATKRKKRAESKLATSERRKREWQRKSQIKDLVDHGLETEIAEEWIFAGYSSEETKEWIKHRDIRLPDDATAWLDIGVTSPEDLNRWYAMGHTNIAAVKKQMAFEKREREKYAGMKLSSEVIANWNNIGATTSTQVAYLINNGFTIAELKEWMASGFRKLRTIESWRAAKLSPKESKRWLNGGFTAKESITHRASGLTLDQIKRWEDIFGPLAISVERVNRWRKAGFDSMQAKRWNSAHRDIGVPVAVSWRDSGYEPESSWVLLESTPDVVDRWRISGLPPKDILTWIGKGFDEPTARPWIAQGLSARQAKLWKDQRYTPLVAKQWLRQGVKSPVRARRLKKITEDVSASFLKGISYISFRKTAKLLDIHKLPARLKVAKTASQRRSINNFDTLTPFAKCLTAYSNKTELSESAIKDIEKAYYHQIDMVDNDGSKFMRRYRNQCEDWTLYIFTIWLRNSKIIEGFQ